MKVTIKPTIKLAIKAVQTAVYKAKEFLAGRKKKNSQVLAIIKKK